MDCTVAASLQTCLELEDARMPTQGGEEEAEGGAYVPSDMGAFAEVMQGGEALPFHNTL